MHHPLRWVFLTISLFFAGVAAFILFESNEEKSILNADISYFLNIFTAKSDLERSLNNEWHALAKKNQLPSELASLREIRIPNRPLNPAEKEVLKLLTKKVRITKQGQHTLEIEIFTEKGNSEDSPDLIILQASIIDTKSTNKLSEVALTIRVPQRQKKTR